MGAEQLVDEPSATDGDVLAFQAIERGEQELRFAVVDGPHVAPGFRVTQLAEDLRALVAV